MYSNVPRLKSFEKICPYCGKTRTYEHRDGYTEVDYSTARDRYIPSVTKDEGCDCILGKMEHSSEKFVLKKQCANCAYNTGGCCVSKDERNDISALFGIRGDLVIKKESGRCKYHQLSKDIFNAFIEFIE